jgi:threonine synthase
MRFISTRDPEHRVGLSTALIQGLSPEGGLYIPESWPAFEFGQLSASDSLSSTAAKFLAPFADADPLAAQLPRITGEAFNFAAPVRPLGQSGLLSVLELFHGPTAAFKDFGARFLAASFARLRAGASRPLQILVATSGDTGGAVAAAFHGRAGIEVTVLFPKGLVSPTQQQQLTCWGDNVRSLAVRGTFDECQRLVKEAFLEPQLRTEWELSSANSINLGRLLPQAVYYVATSTAIARQGRGPASFVIPSGNLGNATACVWARRMGAPIDRIVLAHNANRTVPDFFADGLLRPRPSVATLASAMDVGNPSNLERLRSMFPEIGAIRGALSTVSIDDAAISSRIRADYDRFGAIWCPHTAVAAEAWARLPAAEQQAGPWVLVATAHPAKFSEIVAPLIGKPVPVPENLARLFERPSRFTEIEPTLAALRETLGGRHATV